MNKSRTLFCDVLRECVENGEIAVNCTNADIEPIAKDRGWSVIPLWFRDDNENPMKIGRGRYDLSSLAEDHIPAKTVVSVKTTETAIPVADSTPQATAMNQSLVSSESVIPAKDADFVPWGHFDDVETVIRSGAFYPTFVTGLSGNGKTTMIMQVCAKLKRECYRVNITSQTDEDDLLGGFRLIDGETVWYDGPVIQAMKRGAILLLDEIDLGASPLMCLQPVLEGKGIFLKKINTFVEPAAGFQIFATANTKGKGDETGNFAYTGILNEAFLDRFPVTLEQSYASNGIEKRILLKKMKTLGVEDKVFAGNLVKWADAIRKTFMEGGISEIITTRRLLSITQAFSIFADKAKAISMAISRFDEETKHDFLKLYEKIDEEINLSETTDSAPLEIDSKDPNNCPF
jgi:MoxR-like ATPase